MAYELIELGRRSPRGMITRKGYTRKDGTYVPPTLVKDTGKPGKTPASKRVLPEPTSGALGCGGTGWRRKDSATQRRRVLKCLVMKKKKKCATVIRDLNLLANFTKRTSPATHKAARADMAAIRKEGWCKLKGKVRKSH
jgi:hypothetical protein